MENKGTEIFFLCDGHVPNCDKSYCYKFGGECRHTDNIRFALNFHLVDADRNGYFENYAEYQKNDKPDAVMHAAIIGD